jgi:hypothetical protein
MMYNAVADTDERRQGARMSQAWQDKLVQQREALADILRDPLEQITRNCIPVWARRENIENIFLLSFSRIPYCANLYALNTDGIQITETVARNGIQAGHLGRDRSQRPYLKTVVPAWGFLLSDVYTNLNQHYPSITALQVIRTSDGVLGYIGVDFDLRDLPLTAELYPDPSEWQAATTDEPTPSPDSQHAFVSCPLQQLLDTILSLLEVLLTERGVFQCQIHFSSCQLAIWTLNDPTRYSLLDHAALTDSELLLRYPKHDYPELAKIPQQRIARVLDTLRSLRTGDECFYLQQASINIINGMISITCSRDGLHYLPYDELLLSGVDLGGVDLGSAKARGRITPHPSSKFM